MNVPLRTLPRMGDEIDEADRFGDLPHPREMLDLVGHAEAEQSLLDAYRSGRMHHAWILGGLEGIGKAVLAYRFARFVLTHGDPSAPVVRAAGSLDVDANARAARLVAGQAHPDLFVLRREWNEKNKKPFTDIRVDDVRKANHLFGSTASAGGWRIIIVDSVENLNANSANALLKVLEEPPARALFLMVAHQPGRILPTIRSRCRMLALRPLETPQIERILTGLGEIDASPAHIAEAVSAAEGSVKRAFRLIDSETHAFRAKLLALFEALPVIDERLALQIAEETLKRDGVAFEHFVETTEAYLSAAVGARLSSGPAKIIRFAEAYEAFAAKRREAEIYNLDRRPLVLATIAELADAVRHAAA